MDSGEDFEFNIQRTFDRLIEDFEIYGGIIIPRGRYYFTHWVNTVSHTYHPL